MQGCPVETPTAFFACYFDGLIYFEGEVFFGVVVADIFDHSAEQGDILRDQAGFDVVCQYVAEDSAEIFVPRVRQKTAGIS